ncbi:sugar-binding transcriptional regulator [Actinomyces qiguomingii]|uniref:sugar-binding transcriptional regulator n=1 Tax=Actinomyces qiguomingii TaxID=2057800 RepID=UPI000CA047F6|nr:sugar-binding domain-containing protein [Actinomyces qiguomingii]
MPDDTGLMIAVARAYYEAGEAKVNIAERFGISRFKVARLLDTARETGIVQIRIVEPTRPDEALAERVAAHLNLRDCVVVPGAEGEAANRQALARAAAVEISSLVGRRETIGFSWGRTIAEIGAHVGSLADVRVVALTGAVGADFALSPVDIFRSVSTHSGSTTLSIFAPMFVDSPQTAEALRRDPAIASVLAAYAELSLAVVSIGSWDPPVTQLMDALSDADKQQLESGGARAEMLGIFIDDDGRVVPCAARSRCIAITAQQLVRTPRVLAVAGGVRKVPAMRAVARSGLITSLVTDRRTAQMLLDGPAVAGREINR